MSSPTKRPPKYFKKERVENLEKVVKELKNNPQLVYLPELKFFREYLVNDLRAKLPERADMKVGSQVEQVDSIDIPTLGVKLEKSEIPKWLDEDRFVDLIGDPKFLKEISDSATLRILHDLSRDPSLYSTYSHIPAVQKVFERFLKESQSTVKKNHASSST